MFDTLSIPFEPYQALPEKLRWFVACVAGHADRDGYCYPTERGLAGKFGMSLSTVCRRLKEAAAAGCFTRTRKPGKRYQYVIAEPYRLRWPKRRERPEPAGVSPLKRGVSQAARQQAKPLKHIREERSARFAGEGQDGLPRAVDWGPRIRGWDQRRFWLTDWGPPPGQPGCWIPAHLLPGNAGGGDVRHR